MSEGRKIRVEVAYALADKQVVVPLDVEEGTTMLQAVIRSRIADQFPGMIDPERIAMGIFAKVEPSPATRVLAEGERVELYRQLVADPNDSRKDRAQKAKQKRAQDG